METRYFGGGLESELPARPVFEAMRRGFAGRCPHCGEGPIFWKFLKTVERCEACGAEIFHHRADDFPAYVVILIAGHIMVGAAVLVTSLMALPLWAHLAIWIPLTVIVAVALLQPVKGAIIGLQWALYMHGFGGDEDVLETHPEMRERLD